MLSRIGLVLGLTGLVGCEAWLNVEAPQCKTNQDCVGLLGRSYTCGSDGICLAPVVKDAGMDDPSKPSLPTRWACVNDPAPDFVEDPDRTVTVRMDVVDLTTLRVPADLTAKACLPSDVYCSSPLLDMQHPGADGFFEFILPYGFDGTLMFDAPGQVPGISSTSRPYLQNITVTGPTLPTPSSLDDLSDHAGHPVVEGTGLIIIEMRDCLDNPGDGVSFDVISQPSGDQTPFYFDGALPARQLTSTTISNALGAGRVSLAVGGFSNIEEGNASIVARLESNNVMIGHTTIQVQKGHITYLKLYAGP